MSSTTLVDDWTNRLTGLSMDRIAESRERLEALNIAHLSAEICRRADDDSWVALWWSNGAPALSVRQVLSTLDLPKNVLGVILLGAAVAVPVPEIHYYRVVLPWEELTAIEEKPTVFSGENHPLAEPVFEAIEDSTGLRPSLIVNPYGPRRRRQRLLSRDGSRAIHPFNLLIDRDPPEMREFVTTSSG